EVDGGRVVAVLARKANRTSSSPDFYTGDWVAVSASGTAKLYLDGVVLSAYRTLGLWAMDSSTIVLDNSMVSEAYGANVDEDALLVVRNSFIQANLSAIYAMGKAEFVYSTIWGVQDGSINCEPTAEVVMRNSVYNR